MKTIPGLFSHLRVCSSELFALLGCRRQSCLHPSFPSQKCFAPCWVVMVHHTEQLLAARALGSPLGKLLRHWLQGVGRGGHRLELPLQWRKSGSFTRQCQSEGKGHIFVFRRLQPAEGTIKAQKTAHLRAASLPLGVLFVAPLLRALCGL